MKAKRISFKEWKERVINATENGQECLYKKQETDERGYRKNYYLINGELVYYIYKRNLYGENTNR